MLDTLISAIGRMLPNSDTYKIFGQPAAGKTYPYISERELRTAARELLDNMPQMTLAQIHEDMQPFLEDMAFPDAPDPQIYVLCFLRWAEFTPRISLPALTIKRWLLQENDITDIVQDQLHKTGSQHRHLVTEEAGISKVPAMAVTLAFITGLAGEARLLT